MAGVDISQQISTDCCFEVAVGYLIRSVTWSVRRGAERQPTIHVEDVSLIIAHELLRSRLLATDVIGALNEVTQG